MSREDIHCTIKSRHPIKAAPFCGIPGPEQAPVPRISAAVTANIRRQPHVAGSLRWSIRPAGAALYVKAAQRNIRAAGISISAIETISISRRGALCSNDDVL